MLRKSIFALALGFNCYCLASTPASLVDAQIDSTLKSNKIVFIDGQVSEEQRARDIDSLRNVITAFYYDQFRHYSDPGAPYFLFLSKDSQLAMGIGGGVRMRAYYDWGGAIPSSGFAPYLIPIPANPAAMRQFGTSPAGTCLYFRVIGRNKALGNYQLYIEANFNGYEVRDFHLKKAYAVVNDFTIGYASSTFSDPAATPPTVDAQGPNNKIGATSVLVRYMPVVKKHWYFAVSAETPSTAIDADGVKTQAVTNWLPDAAAFVQYEWGQGQHVRLSGIVRSLSYRDLISEKNHNKAGWGVMLSSVAHPHTAFTTYVTLNYGHGFAGLGGDMLIGKYDLVANPERPGELYAPRSFGWCLGLQYNFKPNLFASITASQCRYLPNGSIDGKDYKYGIYSCANIFWNVTPRIQFGAEFDLGFRRNFNGEHRYARRAGAVCQFSF
ncbi:MAG: hypothetical protein K2L84_06555 [Muribaculaceae bacterium]|nr:hypothetical protein [Muribaculaceae bacterium]